MKLNAIKKSINYFFIKFFKLNVFNFLMLKIDLKFKQALSNRFSVKKIKSVLK